MAAIPGLAQEPEAEDETFDEVMAGKNVRDRFQIQLGGYFPELSSGVALSPSGLGAGTAINLEDLLDLENRERVFRLRGYWRFGLKKRVDFGWYEINRSSSGLVDEEFQWGDDIINVDSFVDSTFKAGVLTALYGYSMVHNSKIESGVSVGISGLDFSASLFATDNDTGDISDDGYSGTLVDFGISSSYYPWKHIGFGAGYDGYTIDVTIRKDEFNGAIKYENRGFNAFLIGVF